MFSKLYQETYDTIRSSVYKQIFSSEGETFRKLVEENFRGQEIKPTKEVAEKFLITQSTVEGCNCYKYENEKAEQSILYIHGGGFFIDIDERYWAYAADLCERGNAEVYMPQYPVAPEYTCEPTYQMLLTLYQEILKKRDPNHIIVMGDSAGGGIALSFGMLLRDKHLPQPKELILVCPCLKLANLSEEDKEAGEALEKVDPMISYQCMDTVRKFWGGDRKMEDYLVNPFYGDLQGLADITMFSGTWDILYLYNKQFYERAKEENRSIRFYVKEEMIHDYVVFLFEESMEHQQIVIDTILCPIGTK